MKAIILAGGKGTRLQTVISAVPKPLAPVQGQPFIFILVRFLLFHGIKEIIISTHHLAEKFGGYLEDFKKIAQSISLIKEPAPLGTGGALRFSCQQFSASENILVLNGDTFFDFDLSAFVKKYARETALALKEVPDSARYGTVELKDGNIQKFTEKSKTPAFGAIYAGFAIVSTQDILDFLPEGSSSLEKDFFPKLLRESRPVKGEIFNGKFIDIGIPEDYSVANTLFDFSKFLR